MKPANKTLTGPSQHPLQVCGQFTANLKHKTQEVKEEIFVVRGLQMSLIGRPAIEALGLVSRVSSVEDHGQAVIAKFPQLFQGLGTLEEEHHIKLKEDAKPFALSTPRRVALPLRPKVEAELQRMEQLGVISRVDEPTGVLGWSLYPSRMEMSAYVSTSPN